MFRLMIIVILLVLAGCSPPPLGEPLDITLEDYDELPFVSLVEIELNQLVVYRNPGKEVVGKIMNLKSGGDGLIVTPEGEIRNHRWIKIWIYDGNRFFRSKLYQDDLDRLRQLVPNHQTTGVEE